jgi:hypothetical protein
LSGVFVRAIRYDGSRHRLQRFCNFLITLVESGVAATAGCGAGAAVHPATRASVVISDSNLFMIIFPALKQNRVRHDHKPLL